MNRRGVGSVMLGGSWLWARMRILSDTGLTAVRSVHGGCCALHWPKRRCGVMRRHELGLYKGKRECEASWSGP
jgi:hypothetical protein